MLSSESLIVDRPYQDALTGLASQVHPITEAVVYGAARIAERLQAKMVVIATHSGRTALIKAKQRAFISTVAVSSHESTLRRMTLYWGIEPLRGAPEDVGTGLQKFIDQWGQRHGVLVSGDRVVMVTGTGYGLGAHNRVEIHEVV